MQTGRRNNGNDPEQSGPESGPASARAHHLRRQRSRLPELGPVPSDDEISRLNDGAADPRHVLRPSSRTLPEPQGRSESHRDQRNGDPELLVAGQLGALQRPQCRARSARGTALRQPAQRRFGHAQEQEFGHRGPPRPGRASLLHPRSGHRCRQPFRQSDASPRVGF